MDIKFDKETGTLYLKFSDDKIEDTREEKPGVIIDYDEKGEIVGIEILSVSAKLEKSGMYSI